MIEVKYLITEKYIKSIEADSAVSYERACELVDMEMMYIIKSVIYIRAWPISYENKEKLLPAQFSEN